MLDVHFRVRALGREVAHHIRIHVPDRAVGADVGGAKHPPRPRTAILNPPVAAYDVMQRIFQLLVLFAICCRIVAGRNLSPRGKCHGCKKQRACQADCRHGHQVLLVYHYTCGKAAARCNDLYNINSFFGRHYTLALSV